MRDYLHIGPVPAEEACSQIGKTDNATSLSKLEAEAYTVALRKKYGAEPAGVRLSPHREEHDFGPYYEVVCHYDASVQGAMTYALKVERGLLRWDEVGMWPPVKYDDRGQPLYVIRDSWLWERANNPDCLVYRKDGTKP